MKIYPLKDGDFSVDKNKNFTYLEDTKNDKNLKMAVQPFLIETASNLVLPDAGLGLDGNRNLVNLPLELRPTNDEH